MESETKINLSDLSKIPPKEFEKNFREWLDRDDVARSLQAQLRMDLIKNFNKTALGRQILSQATSTNKPYGANATQRLTLSPMVLALNTLVAEFLYAENCHFSLSVFCTEIPFRNTIPDFENSQYFRFTEFEICEILEAVSGTAKYEKDLKNQIVKEYETNARSSLLLLILKHIINLTITEQRDKTEKPPPLPLPVIQKTSQLSESLPFSEKKKPSSSEVKTKKSTNNLRCVNKYLIALSNKLQCMSRQLYLLQQQQKPDPKTLPRPRQLKTSSQHSFRNLNRSLEIITGNLKNMALAKRKNKRFGVIVTAIETMSNQFEKCAINFEKIFKNLVDNEKSLKREISTSMPEMSYTEWINDLRASEHGQKFLDKVENSLRKALNRQKKLLAQEIETKLCHQKELLKIRYKQKLMKHLPKRDPSLEFDKLNDSVEKQLEQFELKHCEMIQRFHDQEQNNVRCAVPSKIMPVTMVEIKPNQMKTKSTTTTATKPTDALVITLKNHEQKSTSLSPIVSPKQSFKPTLLLKSPPKQEASKAKLPLSARSHALKAAAQSNLDEMILRIAADERKVDNIVFDAKLRLQKLEIESNQLEQNFHQYLERQQKQKQICREASATMWNNYLLEKNKIENKYEMLRHATKSVPQLESNVYNHQDSDREYEKFMHEVNAKRTDMSFIETSKNDNISSSPNCKNPILEAKAKLFQSDKSVHKAKETKKHIDKKQTYAHLNNVTEDLIYTVEHDSLGLSHKLITLGESQKGRKRTKALDSKTARIKLFEANVLNKDSYKSGPYDSETEVTGVESNDSHLSTSDTETNVLLAPLSSSRVQGKIQTIDDELNQKTQEHLQKISSRPRLKPWTTTTTPKSSDHKMMQTLFAGRDNVGDFDERNFNKEGALKGANKDSLWDEEKPSTSKIHQPPPNTPTKTSTTMVLQQSMAKMNRLFQNEQQRRRQIKKQHKMKEQKQQQLQMLMQLQQKQQQTLERISVRKAKGTTTIDTTPITITTATNTSTMLFEQDPKRIVDDNAVAGVEKKLETLKSSTSVAAAAATSALATNGGKSKSETGNKIDVKKSAAEILTETVATLTSWSTSLINEGATEQTLNSPSTITIKAQTTEITAISPQNAQSDNCYEVKPLNAGNKNKFNAINQQQRQQEREQQREKQQQHCQQQPQEQHSDKQQAEQHQDLEEKLSLHPVAPLQEDTSSLQRAIEDVADGDGIVAASNSPLTTVATSQLDVDIGVGLDIEADADDFDDLLLAPFSGSTMSMSSLLAFQFSTGFTRPHGSGGDDGVGNLNEEGNEFWA